MKNVYIMNIFSHNTRTDMFEHWDTKVFTSYATALGHIKDRIRVNKGKNVIVDNYGVSNIDMFTYEASGWEAARATDEKPTDYHKVRYTLSKKTFGFCRKESKTTDPKSLAS